MIDVELTASPVSLDAWRAPAHVFRADFESVTADAEPAPRLPRSWTELEALVESRLAAFDERQRRENDAHFERGLLEGRRQRESEWEQRLAAAHAPLKQVADRVTAELTHARESLYTQAAELAAALAEAWLGRLVAINTVAFTAALRDALEPLAHMDDISVRLHPDDHRTLRDGLAAGDESLLAFESLRIIADPSLERGGAVAESAGGTVDARLATRRQRALQALQCGDSGDADAGR